MQVYTGYRYPYWNSLFGSSPVYLHLTAWLVLGQMVCGKR
jgi:hypothetical protein